MERSFTLLTISLWEEIGLKKLLSVPEIYTRTAGLIPTLVNSFLLKKNNRPAHTTYCEHSEAVKGLTRLFILWL